MRLIAIFQAALVLIVFVATADIAKAQTGFPLLGLWEAVSATAPDGTPVDISSVRGEYEFKADGTVVITAINKPGSKPVRIRFLYEFIPPDIMNLRLAGAQLPITDKYKFVHKGDSFTQHQLEYGTKSVFRRIDKTKFNERDIEDTQNLQKVLTE